LESACGKLAFRWSCFPREAYFQKRFDGKAFFLVLAFAALASSAEAFLEAEEDRSMPIFEL
jgi:hypothetical protein